MLRCNGRCIVEIAINSPLVSASKQRGSSSQQSSLPKGRRFLSLSLPLSLSLSLSLFLWNMGGVGMRRQVPKPWDENASPPD